MSELDEYVIDGVIYTTKISPDDSCIGCIGFDDPSSAICEELQSNCKNKIWVIKEENKLQDLQNVSFNTLPNNEGIQLKINGGKLEEYIKAIEEKYPEEERTAINPKHYDLFPEYGIQVRELMQVLCDKLDRQGFSGFLCSDYVQAMQYFLRWFEKNGAEDIEKGIWYMNKVIQQVQEEEYNNGN